jgi:SAM-dependent methyltransferase
VGLSYHEAKMLLDARRRGVSFERTLTIGHQSLFLHPIEVKRLHREYLANGPSLPRLLLKDCEWGAYCDSFFHDCLGVATLDILDNSAYEGATLLHDLNQPVPEKLWGKYDAIVDGGSLEHVFNFPVAVASLLRMLRVGGSIFMSVPANNLCGHGFYQFSPELMFRVFSRENGFELLRVVLLQGRFPDVLLSRVLGAYQVTDPAKVGTRVGLMSASPAMMMVEAIKTEECMPFALTPQQSDYVTLWQAKTGAAPSPMKKVLRRMASGLPGSVQRRLRGYYLSWLFSFHNRRFYKKLS